jgi:endonuclease/exonuclease/phosphatase family metal-dependent hydrolase
MCTFRYSVIEATPIRLYYTAYKMLCYSRVTSLRSMSDKLTEKLSQKRNWSLCLLAILSLPLFLILLFVANSFWPGSHTPDSGLTASPPVSGSIQRMKLMSYNIRWCKKSEDCLDRVADLIEEEKPDIVFLAAIYYECATCAVRNQVAHIVDKTGFHAFGFGENYKLGVPFYSNRSGNALLSRFPLSELYAQPLSGGSYDPRTRRRALWAEINLNGEKVLLGSLHNSYFPQEDNLLQVGEILEYIDGRPTLLGGDFNATSESPSMQTFLRSGLFVGDLDGPPTYPAHNPDRRLDYILAPSSWHLLEHKTLTKELSAHLPVVSTFSIAQ